MFFLLFYTLLHPLPNPCPRSGGGAFSSVCATVGVLDCPVALWARIFTSSFLLLFSPQRHPYNLRISFLMLKRFKAVSGLFGPVLCPLLELSLFPVPFSFSPCPLFRPFLGFYGLFSALWGASVCSVYAQGFKSILSFVLCAKFLARTPGFSKRAGYLAPICRLSALAWAQKTHGG